MCVLHFRTLVNSAYLCQRPRASNKYRWGQETPRSRTHASWNVICFTYVAVAVLAGCTTPQQRKPEAAGVLLNAAAAIRPNVEDTVASTAKQRADASSRLAGTRIPFIENKGQGDPNVKFSAATFGGTVFVTRTGELVYSLPTSSPSGRDNDGSATARRLVLREELVDASVTEVRGDAAAPTRVNVFHGSDRSRWRTNTATYQTITLGEVYPGVTARLTAHGSTVEKLFYVEPTAAPEQIRVRMKGGQKLATTNSGELAVTTELGDVRFSRPIAYQEVDGARLFVDVSYVIDGDTYGFKLGAYDRERELVIDPILAATFAGGSQADAVNAITVDDSGNVYVTGYTSSPDFPGASAGLADSSYEEASEAFILKLDTSLSTILAATFLGGSASEEATRIALDAKGNVYVAGYTWSGDFPGISSNSADPTWNGMEGFIAKLDSNLTTILTSTFVGGKDADRTTGLALSNTGEVYVAGNTGCNFPFVSATAADSSCSQVEGFVARLDADLTKMRATFVGGSKLEDAVSIALDSSNNVYVLGRTLSLDIPGISASSADPTPGTYPPPGLPPGQPPPAPHYDAFVVRLDPALTTLSSTYLAGDGGEHARALALSGGNVYVAGTARHRSGGGTPDDFPGVPAGATVAQPWYEAAFVSRLNGSLSTVHTFLFSGPFSSSRLALVPDGAGNIYLATEEVLPIANVGPDAADPVRSGREGFVALLDGAQLTFLKTTYLGGSGVSPGDEIPRALAVDSAGNLYVGGTAISPDFPGVNASSADPTIMDGEGYVAKLGGCNGVAQIWHATLVGGPLEACQLTRFPLFDGELEAGCQIGGCCPQCLDAPMDWQMFVRSTPVRSIVVRFVGLDVREAQRVEIEGGAQWLSENRLLVNANEEIVLRGLPFPGSRQQPSYRAVVERVILERPEQFDGRATLDVIQSVGDQTIAETTLSFVGAGVGVR